MVRQNLFTGWFALVFLAAFASELTNCLLVHFPGYLLDLGADELRIGVIVGVAGLAAILVRPWMAVSWIFTVAGSSSESARSSLRSPVADGLHRPDRIGPR